MIILDRPEDLDFRTLVKPGDTVVCAQALSEPVSLTRRLLAQRAEIGPFTLFLGPSFSDTFRPEHTDVVSFRSYCGTARNSTLAAAGVLDVLPAHYSDLSQFYASGALASDVVLLTVGEPDEQGRFNLGLHNDYLLDAARRARVVIVEVSRSVPWVFGAELPADIRVDVAVRTGRDLLTFGATTKEKAGAAEQGIAERVAAMVPHGATLELGIGVLPNLVLQALKAHKDLGIHSGMISDGVVDLMESGVITNANKPIDRGVTVAGMLIGSRRLLDYAHRNPRIRLASSRETHDAAALRKLPGFFAINGAVEIDLSGQVNAECLNGRYVGAVGGQVEFVRGANSAEGGRALMLLPATAKGGMLSRIVPKLNDSVVTTPRSDVDVVVTEFGAAELRGKTLAERAQALIAIAHPDFRDALARAGK